MERNDKLWPLEEDQKQEEEMKTAARDGSIQQEMEREEKVNESSGTAAAATFCWTPYHFNEPLLLHKDSNSEKSAAVNN